MPLIRWEEIWHVCVTGLLFPEVIVDFFFHYDFLIASKEHEWMQDILKPSNIWFWSDQFDIVIE